MCNFFADPDCPRPLLMNLIPTSRLGMLGLCARSLYSSSLYGDMESLAPRSPMLHQSINGSLLLLLLLCKISSARCSIRLPANLLEKDFKPTNRSNSLCNTTSSPNILSLWLSLLVELQLLQRLIASWQLTFAKPCKKE